MGAMSVFGIFPNEIFTNLDQYWWIALFWMPAVFINRKSDYSKRYTPWFWLGVFFYVSGIYCLVARLSRATALQS